MTIEGPLLSQTAQTAYQGRVTAIGKDDAGTPTCDWRPSAGYPVPPADAKELWINFVDAKTRTINLQAGDYYHAKMEPLGERHFIAFIWRTGLSKFGVGDWMVARYGDPPGKVGLTGCRNCTVKDVTLMRNGFAPIFDGEGGGNHYLRVPLGAGAAPGGGDGRPGRHQCRRRHPLTGRQCRPGHRELHVRRRVFGRLHRHPRRLPLDSSAPTARSIVAENGYAFYRVGEPVRISNDQGFYLQANVTALKDNGDGTSTLTLDTTETIPTDAYLSSPARRRRRRATRSSAADWATRARAGSSSSRTTA